MRSDLEVLGIDPDEAIKYNVSLEELTEARNQQLLLHHTPKSACGSDASHHTSAGEFPAAAAANRDTARVMDGLDRYKRMKQVKILSCVFVAWHYLKQTKCFCHSDVVPNIRSRIR